MALVAYVAIDAQGREVQGDLEAPDEAGAAAQLRGRGLFPLEVKRGTAARAAAADAREGRLPALVRSGDVVLFLSQLGLMLRTGLTLLQALETLAGTAARPGLRRCARRLGLAVSGGRTLSAALTDEARLFPPLVVQLVRMAEATGELPEALARAAEHIERRAALRRQLAASLSYPALVMTASFAVFIYLTTGLIPKLAAFLAQRGRALPWSTRFLMDLSAFVQAWWPWALLASALALAGLLLVRQTARGRLLTDRAVLSIPLLGGVLRNAALAHLGETLGLLLRSGLPLVESLRVLEGSYESRAWSGIIGRAREQVVRGTTLADALAEPLVPPMTLQVVAVGERSGALDEVLRELGAYHDQVLQRNIRTLSALVEPGMIVLVGGMVGFVYYSFFQALMSLAGR